MSRYGERTRISEAVSALGRKPAGNGYGVATLSGSGASSTSITVSSVNYTLLTAINDGTLTVSKAGLFDCLLVGGGGTGGGGQESFGTGGGGGGGGVVIQTVFLAAGSYTVDIGAGGSNGNAITSNTGKTTAIEAAARTFTLAAVGGGIGDYRTNAFRLNRPTAGGSSGGCGNSNSATSPAVSTQGHLGGTGGVSGTYAGGGGGGGGAGAAGANGSGNVGGAGGAGVEVNTFIGGASTFKAGGGGGGGNGGNGANGSGNGSNNTGGGGQGRGEASNADGTVGFSGIAYIRFKV